MRTYKEKREILDAIKEALWTRLEACSKPDQYGNWPPSRSIKDCLQSLLSAYKLQGYDRHE